MTTLSDREMQVLGTVKFEALGLKIDAVKTHERKLIVLVTNISKDGPRKLGSS